MNQTKTLVMKERMQKERRRRREDGGTCIELFPEPPWRALVVVSRGIVIKGAVPQGGAQWLGDNIAPGILDEDLLRDGLLDVVLVDDDLPPQQLNLVCQLLLLKEQDRWVLVHEGKAVLEGHHAGSVLGGKEVRTGASNNSNTWHSHSRPCRPSTTKTWPHLPLSPRSCGTLTPRRIHSAS